MHSSRSELHVAELPHGALRALAIRAATSCSTPFYLIDIDRVVSSARLALYGWSSIFPNGRLAYSYKTNSLKAVTSALAAEGYAAETVSGDELGFALGDGVRTGVYLGGPTLSAAEFQLGIAAGCIVKIDSLAQLDVAIAAATHCGQPLRSLLRLAVWRGERWSRFGLLPNEIEAALAHADKAGAEIRGVHFHLGSNLVDLDLYSKTALLHLPVVRRLLANNCDRSTILNVGGGFPSQSWKSQQRPRDLTSVGHDIRTALAPHIDLNLLEIVAEPGRALVEDFGVLVTRVVAVKARPDRPALFVDGGTNLTSTLHLWRHPVEIIDDVGPDAERIPYDVYGSQCFEADRFAEGVLGPERMRLGSVVLVYQTGGYDVNGANLWLRSGAPVVAHRNGGLTEVRPGYDVRQIRGRAG